MKKKGLALLLALVTALALPACGGGAQPDTSAEQTASVSAELRLLEQNGGKIKERAERLKLRLIKDADCKTQAVCGPSVLKCRGCGASLSLMEGKTCRFCGRELDLKRYDWVIKDYEIVK